MSYDEHLISIASGDGDKLDRIQRRAEMHPKFWGSDDAKAAFRDREHLLALVREQAAKLDAIRELHAEDLFRGHLSNGCKTCGNVGDLGYPCPTIAALEATK